MGAVDEDKRCRTCGSYNVACGLKYELNGKQCPCSICLLKTMCTDKDDMCNDIMSYIKLHRDLNVRGWGE